MSRFLARSASLLAASAAFTLASSPLVAATKAKAAAAAPALQKIEFVHQFGPDQAAQLAALVERFNAETKGIEITLSKRDWAQGQMPGLMLLREADEDQLIAAKRFKPVWEVMKLGGKPLPVSRTPAMVMPSFIDKSRRLNGLPVAFASPLMFYNRDALSAAGVDANKPPTTWQGWQDVLGKLAEAGYECPYTTTDPVSIFVESTSAWNNQAYTTGKQEALAVNGLVQVKHLGMMSTWHKSRYLRVFASNEAAQEVFSSGVCAVLSAPSSAYPGLVRQSKFGVGVAPLPYHADAYGAPQNALADGASLWIGEGRSTAEYKAISRFVSYWLSPKTQLEWQIKAGYLPLTPTGIFTAANSRVLDEQLLSQRLALAQLFHKPANAATGATMYARRLGVRRILNEELNAIWSEQKNAKEALDSAVQRVRAGEGGCCRSLVMR